MHLLLIETSMVEYDVPQIEVTRLQFTVEDFADSKKQATAVTKFAALIRAKLHLIAEQGEELKKWLLDSAPNDTLLIETSDRDSACLVYCDPDHLPELTRLVVDQIETVQITATLMPIPGTKKTKTKSRKK